MEGTREFEWKKLKHYPVPKSVRIEVVILILCTAGSLFLALATCLAISVLLPEPFEILLVLPFLTVLLGSVYTDYRLRYLPAKEAAESEGWTMKLSSNASRARRKLWTSLPIEIVNRRMKVWYAVALASFLGIFPVGMLLSGRPFVAFITLPLLLLAGVSFFCGLFWDVQGDTIESRAWIEENGYRELGESEAP